PLPLFPEGKQRADLEVAGSDIEASRDARPFLEVAQAGPPGDAVVDDEKVAALTFGCHRVLFLPTLRPRRASRVLHNRGKLEHRHLDGQAQARAAREQVPTYVVGLRDLEVSRTSVLLPRVLPASLGSAVL